MSKELYLMKRVEELQKENYRLKLELLGNQMEQDFNVFDLCPILYYGSSLSTGYEGYPTFEKVTIPSLLKKGGYLVLTHEGVGETSKQYVIWSNTPKKKSSE